MTYKEQCKEEKKYNSLSKQIGKALQGQLFTNEEQIIKSLKRRDKNVYSN